MVSRSWIPVSSPHGKFMSSDVVGREIRRHTRAKIRASSRVGRGKWWLESSPAARPAYIIRSQTR